LEGANPGELTKLVSAAAASAASAQQQPKQDLNQRLAQLINQAHVTLFMKGTPEAPRCGFSSKIVAILKKNNIPFASFDILSDEEVRNGLKAYSNWPTYPQLYGKGKLVGGLDIAKELDEAGELLSELSLTPADLAAASNATAASDAPVVPPPSLNDRLHKLINYAHIMVFMKGTPQAPRCGFSSKVCDILNQAEVQYSAFDILSDEEVRNGLKTYSNWPTYPQVYAKGKLIGGLDIVRELYESNELLEALQWQK